MQKLKSVHKGILSELNSVETYDNVNVENGKKEKRVTYNLPSEEEDEEEESYGYSNKAFVDWNGEEPKKCEIKNEAQILDIDSDANPTEDNGETFKLTEQCSLFSQLSENNLEVQDVEPQKEDNECQVVEVKAREIVRSVITAVESLVVPGPNDVEMVQIGDDTDTEPETHSPKLGRQKRPEKFDLEKDKGKSPSKKPKTTDDFSTPQPDLVKIGGPPTTSMHHPKQTDPYKTSPISKDVETEKFPEPYQHKSSKLGEKIEGPDLVAGLDSVIFKKEKRKSSTKSRDDVPENDYDSFYGSDKDNDEELVFSEDEIRVDVCDSDSTDDEVCDERVSSLCICRRLSCV